MQQPRAVITGFAQPRQGVRLSPDGKALYVTNFVGDEITIVDTASNKITGEITGFDKLRAISVTADGKTIFAANSGSNTIACRRRQAIGSLPRSRSAKTRTALRSPDGQFVYAGNLGDSTVSVIAVASHKVVATITGFKKPRQAIVFTRAAMRWLRRSSGRLTRTSPRQGRPRCRGKARGQHQGRQLGKWGQAPMPPFLN